MATLCKDCGLDTAPCTERRGCRHAGRWEHYMVHNKLWTKAGMEDGYLCVGCLEKRIGRKLRSTDFTLCLLNNLDHPWHTQRLASRLASFKDMKLTAAHEAGHFVISKLLGGSPSAEINPIDPKNRKGKWKGTCTQLDNKAPITDRHMFGVAGAVAEHIAKGKSIIDELFCVMPYDSQDYFSLCFSESDLKSFSHLSLGWRVRRIPGRNPRFFVF